MIRICLGDLENLEPLRLPLEKVFELGIENFAQQNLLKIDPAKQESLLDFSLTRFIRWYHGQTSIPQPLCESAVSAFTQEHDLALMATRIEKLHTILQDQKISQSLLTTYKRLRNILKSSQTTAPLQIDRLVAPEEKKLSGWLDQQTSEQTIDQWSQRNFAQLANLLDKFFAQVLIKCPDIDLQNNRIALLKKIKNSLDQLADFDRII